MTSTDYSENALVEQPAIALFASLAFETANCFDEQIGGSAPTHGRETTADVILTRRLRAALEFLNPGVRREVIDGAVEELARDRSAVSLAHANRDVYKLLKDGVKVTYQDDEGGEAVETVRVIDWDQPDNNDWFLASQFWVSGDLYKRRCDLVGFVNGLPLLLVELKKSHGKIEHAYQHNLKDYKQTIPQLFWYNAFIILSNGSQAKVGSVTAGWEHFSDWKRINSEGEAGVVSLETLILGTCEKTRFLDLVENFTVFDEGKGGLVKVVAKNHQFLGVTNSVNALKKIKDNQGRLGVFWHTQGSGKSFSMIFFSQKILRKMPGNWTFVVITDRDDLDNQIYKNFQNTGAVAEECQATSGENLKQLLREDHRYIFTLIQKFVTKKGQKYPKLSDRSDIIVMTDEAHRSQYDTLALNMRNALPKAAFIGFTGTPLMAGEERTKEVFGDYVSIYNFRQSIEDGATVPLYYENRIPELQLANENFKEDLENLIDQAELDEEQQEKLEREFAREYHLITRDDRLEKIAEDLVTHFMGREQGGKAMVVSIDRLTAVKMYNKVQTHWKEYLADLKAELPRADPLRRPGLEEKIRYMEQTEMAVVISSEQNEVDYFKERGFDITPHRKRMVTEDLETKFKNADVPFRVVFVCAMWMTGFDAPAVSTIYLDKPMRNHTLMQTIARANRVFGEKNNGLIVDYVGVFRDIQKALAIYGSGSGGGVKPGECPVQKKAELVAALRDAIQQARTFCEERGVDLDKIIKSKGFHKVASLEDAAAHLVDKKGSEAVADAVEKVIVNDDLKKRYLSLASQVVRLYKAILPDPAANEYMAIKTCLAVLAEKIRSFLPEVSIDDVMEKVGQLLDDSIATKGYVIHATEETRIINLGEIDFEALKAKFDKSSRKRTEAEKLKAGVSGKLQRMVQLNKTRTDLLEKFKKLIEEYNAGMDVDSFFEKLLAFARELNQEDQRGVAEQLNEEELAILDILTKPEIEMTAEDRKQVKAVARKLLQTLKEAKLVLDWRKKLRTRADVFSTVKTVLDDLPRIYSVELYQAKCDSVYRHVYDSYQGEGRSVYSSAQAQ
jgi:type I restriction enzyme R subunit